ncbi:ABC transporter ATP-binding protein [Myxococcus sp. K15C18031901]|uniref:ABC transporter ATP-binding protein n=1 Tax=Myxococcus dinghuensis TaxID=2906761 RepID=UPI0020A6F6FE|nr:ABC transporter ATP-binding protein [Myxococcus dinghuensis]MCP3103908.1 ABC transporter ATP-binding protein [Myxococcus dinghuensis]
MSAEAAVDVELKDVRRAFGATQALRGVSLAVHAGEVYGLVGPDGAGKTTSIRLMAGLLLPDAGQVRTLSEDPAAPRSHVRESLGLVPQRNTLYGDLSVEENLRFFARLFALSKEDFAERRARLLDITRLGRFTDRRADALSGGMYKKLALACALLHRPRVLLLDEPTNGVDPVSRRELWELLYGLVHEGMTLIVSTPYMDEAARCHRVGLLYAGELIAQGAPRELTRAHGVAASDFEAVFLALVEKHTGGRAA